MPATLPKPSVSKEVQSLDGIRPTMAKAVQPKPLRYDQRWWLDREGNSGEAMYTVTYPACGTVACVGGWVTLLTKTESAADSVFDTAMEILGLSRATAFRLFRANAVPENLRPQSLPYARAGARHIAKFQKKYATQLKAKRV